MVNRKKLLPFISNKDLYKHTKTVLGVVKNATEKVEKKLYTRTIDPFSALFDALSQDVTLSQWLELEKTRQIQKTMQNALGDFHENIVGSMFGWEKLPLGGLIDVRNKKRKIIAEIKNKYNTTKGSDKKSIYNNIRSILRKSEGKNFTGYYVEIVPEKKKSYDKSFAPSDNVTKKKRPVNKKIRIIDGKSFYALASGEENALKKLYEVLPIVISDILSKKHEKVTKDKLYTKLFEKAY